MATIDATNSEKILEGTIKWKRTDQDKVVLSADVKGAEWLDSKMDRKDLVNKLKQQLLDDKNKDAEAVGLTVAEGEGLSNQQNPNTPVALPTDAVTGAVGNATGVVGSAIRTLNQLAWGSTPPQPPATSLDASNPSNSPPPPPTYDPHNKTKKDGGKKSKRRRNNNKRHTRKKNNRL